jgi:uncharacterized protein
LRIPIFCFVLLLCIGLGDVSILPAQTPGKFDRPEILPEPTRKFGRRELAGKERILWIGGGHWHDTARYYAQLRYHYETEQKENWHFTYTEDTDVFTRLDDWDAVFMYNQLDTMTVAEEDALLKYINKGKRVVALHSTSVAFMWFYKERFKQYTDLFGAEVTHHPPQQNFPVKVAAPNHPVMQGVSDFTVWDEFYMHKDMSDDRQVLLTGIMDGETLDLAWSRKVGRGELLYIALGHGVEAMSNPALQKIIQNSIHWMLDE